MPAKRQYCLLGTLEPVSRGYVARALRNARKHRMEVVRDRQAAFFYVFMTRSSCDPIVFAPELSIPFPRVLTPSVFTPMPAKTRYAVYSVDSYANYPDVVPAGEYDSLDRAIAHAETVTYKMAVIDQLHESRGFIYTNYESSPLAPSV